MTKTHARLLCRMSCSSLLCLCAFEITYSMSGKLWNLLPFCRLSWVCAVATQVMGYSRERVFVTPPAVGAGASTRFLVVADLGHAQLDGSEEVNFNHVRDNVTYNKNQSLQQARPCALVCRGVYIPP